MYDSLNKEQLKTFLFNLTNLTENLVIFLNSNFQILHINANAVSVFDWNIDEVVGKDFRALCLNSNYPILNALVSKSFKQNSILKQKQIVNNRHLSWRITFLNNENPEKRDIILLGEDVSYQEALLIQNQQSENKLSGVMNVLNNFAKSKLDFGEVNFAEYYSNIINQIPEIIFWKDINGIYLGCNSKFVKFLNLRESKDIIGKSDYDLFPNKSARQLCVNDQQVFSVGHALQFEEAFKQADGTEHVFVSYKAPLFDKSQKIIGIIGVSVDFTQQKMFEQGLLLAKENAEAITGSKFNFISRLFEQVTGQKADSNKTLEEHIVQIRNYLETIISCMPGIIFWKDEKGTYLGCNNNLPESLGLQSRDDVIGKKDYQIFNKLEADLLRKNDIDVMANGKVKSIEESVVMAENNFRIYLTNKVPLYDEGKNKVIGILGISMDITDLKQAEKALREAKELAERMTQAKSNFLATMSHELRTPLNGILGMTQVLLNEKLSEKQQEHIETIQQSGKNLLALISDVLDFSRLEAGQVELHSEEFSPTVLMKEITTVMQHVIQGKPVELKAEVDLNIPHRLLGDVIRLRQIIINLVGNAVKFTLQGHVKIKLNLLSAVDGIAKIEIIVEDTGIGIPSDKLSAIFERFTQVESEYGRRFEGSGLGLAIVKNLVEMMGGAIQVQSEFGVGSRFSSVLPFTIVDKNNEQPIVDTAKNLHSFDKTTQFESYILVVEDNPINQTVMSAMLSNLGCKADVAGNGKEAVKLFEKNSYDLVFMDLGLPDMDGLQVTKLLLNSQKKLKRTSIPIIALTAHVMEDDHKNCLKAGMTEVLTKPIVYAQLVELLKRLIKPAK